MLLACVLSLDLRLKCVQQNMEYAIQVHHAQLASEKSELVEILVESFFHVYLVLSIIKRE